MPAVASSMMDAVDYDATRRRLRIHFISGGWYTYLGVPRAIFRGLLAAPSCGRYFHEHILDRFRFVRR